MRAARAVERNVSSSWLWLYYSFLDAYKARPQDLEDLCDGLACIRAKAEIEKIYNEE